MSDRMQSRLRTALLSPPVVRRAALIGAVLVASGTTAWGADASTQRQRIVTTPAIQDLRPGDIATFTFYYDANDATLPGVALRVHYNSHQLTLADAELLYSASSTGHQDQADAGSAYLDRYDDGDPSTDRRYLAVWSTLGGDWPGTGVVQPLRLLRLRFQVGSGFSASDLTLTGTGCGMCSLELEAATVRVVEAGLTVATSNPTPVPPSPTATSTPAPELEPPAGGSQLTPYGRFEEIPPGIPTLSEWGALLLGAALAASAITVLLRRRG